MLRGPSTYAQHGALRASQQDTWYINNDVPPMFVLAQLCALVAALVSTAVLLSLYVCSGCYRNENLLHHWLKLLLYQSSQHVNRFKLLLEGRRLLLGTVDAAALISLGQVFRVLV